MKSNLYGAFGVGMFSEKVRKSLASQSRSGKTQHSGAFFGE